ncbi:hypothetical protein WJ27_25805 [Burkholderia thailandensis]|nr:hypothetical protein WJ27_25805 [Burkholderia thailandensis]
MAHRASRIAHRASRIAHRASRIAHRASRIAHRASRIHIAARRARRDATPRETAGRNASFASPPAGRATRALRSPFRP